MKRVLFVCVENSCRSQIAEAFAREYDRGRSQAFSAGSRPSGTVNPRALEFMREIGIDLTPQRSKSLADLGEEPFDAAVAMGCGEACPRIAARRRIEWTIPDPKELSAEEFRAVRDRIGAMVRELLEKLAAEPKT